MAFSTIARGKGHSAKDLANHRFGKLVAIQATPERKHGKVMWLCRCDCGKQTVVMSQSLIRGESRSCGCGRFSTHGDTRNYSTTPEYHAWRNMLQRCQNPRAQRYPRYGGRGVKVCDRWKSFEHFLTDMGRRPNADASIDRFPNKDGDYEPGNCRWATRKEQQRNLSTNHKVIVDGATFTLSEWAERLGVPSRKVHGWARDSKRTPIEDRLRELIKANEPAV